MMQQESPSPTTTTLFVRWVARFSSLMIVALVVVLFIGEGGFNPLALSVEEGLEMILLAMAIIGLLLGWLWETAGGFVVVLSVAGFYGVERVMSGRFPRGWALLAVAVPGILFLLAAKSDSWRHRPASR
jgi:hypothetical protein